jgi:hypothetical protein
VSERRDAQSTRQTGRQWHHGMCCARKQNSARRHPRHAAAGARAAIRAAASRRGCPLAPGGARRATWAPLRRRLRPRSPRHEALLGRGLSRASFPVQPGACTLTFLHLVAGRALAEHLAELPQRGAARASASVPRARLTLHPTSWGGTPRRSARPAAAGATRRQACHAQRRPALPGRAHAGALPGRGCTNEGCCFPTQMKNTPSRQALRLPSSARAAALARRGVRRGSTRPRAGSHAARRQRKEGTCWSF